MKRFAEQLKKKSASVKLSATQRRDLRARIVSYMEYHPLPKELVNKSTVSPDLLKSEPFTLVNINTIYTRSFAGLLAILILTVVPTLAERSVPGDVLYPIKMNVNESIRSSLAVSPYAKVEWETERLERRIAEARLLAREGKLTEEVEAEVVKAVQAHSDAAQESIAELRESDSDEAAIAEIAFESALSVQSQVLEGTVEKEVAAAAGASTTPGHSVAALAMVVGEARSDATLKLSGDIPSYDKLAARIEQETSRTYELFAGVKEVALIHEVTDINRRLEDIERKIAEARDLRESGETTGEAEGEEGIVPEVELLKTALSDLRKLISFMTDIDVRENVSIEELVPVTLTREERTAAVNSTLAEATEQIAEFEVSLEAAQSDVRAEKLAIGLGEAKDNVSIAANTLAQGDIGAAETHTTEAVNMLNDLAYIFEEIRKEQNLPEVSEETGTSTEEVIEGEEPGSEEIVEEATATSTEEVTEETEVDEATDETVEDETVE